ncbi:MAG: SusC/RagA family TonB-linked outer membrane protein [Porphyromonadaceae bacterium]|nr:SusC/RagA family TonB-linked outer membrane protein [Porphyromonadaceae bacterium]
MKKGFLFLALLFCSIGMLLAQQRTVKGVVTSKADGLPVIGASVVVKGNPTIGGATNLDGRFTFKVPADAQTLVVSYIGFVTQEISVRDGEIRVVLVPDAQLLEDVVVTATGMTRSKKALGYAATSIKGDIIAQSKAVNPMSALQGRVSGVDISSAPGPGATQNVIIRGASSFGNNQPLYIVDGIPLTNDQNRSGNSLNSQVDFGSGINALNPDDIADVTVLKGAAATALYGSRAANGVIMITTKSGANTEGKMQVSYDAGYTFTRVGRLPQEQTIFGQGWNGARALDENGNWGSPFDGKDRVWGRVIDGKQQTKPYVYLEDRVRDFYEIGQGYKNAISLSGGNAKTNYFLSLSQNTVDGVIPGDHDNYKRYTMSTRGAHKAGRATVSSSVNFSSETTKSVPSGQGASLHRSLYEIANDISIVDFKDLTNPFNTADNYFTPYGLNPYYVLEKDGAIQNKYKIFGKFQLDYDLLESLKFSYRFGGDYETSTSRSHTAPVHFSPGAPNEGSSNENPGSYDQVRRERIQMNHDLLVTYNQALGENFQLSAIAGLNVNEREYSFLRGNITSVDLEGFYNLVNSLTPSLSNERKEIRRLVGAYINADLSYKNFAYLTLTARNDWSSTLPKDKNSYFYPGLTFSLLLPDMLKQYGISTGFMNFAKLRAAYGQTGSDTQPYYVYDRYVLGRSPYPGYPKVDDLEFPINGINAYSASDQQGNPNLRPELTTEFEVGAELKFFNNRVGVDLSYYNRLTKDLISRIPRDPSTGYTYQQSNLGDVRNQGVEITLSITPLKLKDFEWNLAWNYSANRNKVERLDVPEVNIAGFGGAGIYAVEGKAIGQFKISGIKTTIIDGKEKVIVDGKGLPLTTPTQVYMDGRDIHEKYRMGLTNTFRYKGLSLSATLDYRHGGYIWSNTKLYMHWTGSGPETALNDRRPFVFPNSVQEIAPGTFVENNVPVEPDGLHEFYQHKSFGGDWAHVLDRSYLKLRNVGLAYQMPLNLIKKIGLSGLRLSLNASDILLWTPSENVYIDPETTTFGNDVGGKFGEFNANPSNQTYTLGLTLNF